MNVLNAQGLAKAFGPHELFSDIDFAIDMGEKVGVIGPNGSGKSTLFKILASQEDADAGRVDVKRDAQIAYLPQNPTFPEESTPRSVVGEVLGPVREALAAFEAVSEQVGHAEGDEQAALLEEQAALMTKIEQLDGWNWEHRVENILEQLGLRGDDLERPMSQLSGGQRRRVALAQVLLASPDLMILDEPTNHLDADTIAWLEETLAAKRCAVLLVTHDRYFLERVVERIVELAPDGLHSYPGTYAVFLERKLERLRIQHQTRKKQQKLYEQELAWLKRSPSARRTKAQSRVKQVEALEDATTRTRELAMKLDFQAEHRLTKTILEVMGIYKRFEPDRPLLEGVTFSVARGDKLGIVGPNGCGKSTLLRILIDLEEADAGDVSWGKNTRVAYLSQNRMELNPELTVYQSLGPADRVKLGGRSIHKRSYLREFLFRDDEQNKKVASLSGGERCRLLLARVMMENANFLILDEPTNDLDIDTLQLLEDAIVAFDGCVLLVTHDRYLLNRVSTAILAFEEEGIVRYEGDYDFYRERRDARLLAERRAEAEARRERERVEQARKQAKAEPQQRTGLTYGERLELEGMEEAILEAEEAKEAAEAELADPALYSDAPERIPELSEALRVATEKVDALYTRWEELESRSEDT